MTGELRQEVQRLKVEEDIERECVALEAELLRVYIAHHSMSLGFRGSL